MAHNALALKGSDNVEKCLLCDFSICCVLCDIDMNLKGNDKSGSLTNI